MERYERYKDSGVKWIGEIPGHWDMQRWRFLLTENKVKNTDCKEKVQLQFKYGDIVRKANQDEDADVLETISKYTVVAPDDIMINGLNLNYDFISQRVAQVRENGVITSAYISLRPTSLACSRYYTYFLKSMDFKKMFHGMGTGIRLTLSYNELKNQFIPFPVIKEQQAIASYLDKATAKIDEAIAQQQKMIDLLNERKQIIINNAVTKGLNPDAPMKDSGVEWIGEIPEHWEVMPIKRLKSNEINAFVDGPFGSNLKSEHFVENGDVYVIESGLITTGKYVHRELKTITKSHFDTIKRSECKANDIIIAKIGARFGMAGELPELGKPCVVSGNSLKLTLDQSVMQNGMFVNYMGLAKWKGGFVGLYQETAQPALSLGALNNMMLPVPPIEEQLDILEQTNQKLDILDVAIINATKQISLLQERKQIIINDVVTGKVKVS